jgi:hypothetical protein
MRWLFLLTIVGLSHERGAAMQRADDQYSSGLETLVQQSKAIVIGPVDHFSKRVLLTHEQSGTPLRWEISGGLQNPKVLKGRPAVPVKFAVQEQSLMLEKQDKEYWESDFSGWQTGDAAVIFFRDTEGKEGMRVYPSGSGDRDLATIVDHIARIQAINDPAQRFAAWIAAVKSGKSLAERKAALRSVLAFGKSWDEVSPAFRTAMEQPDMRDFTFALVAYCIRTEQWSDALPPAEFLCERLDSEKDSNRILSYLDSFGILLGFANQEDHRTERAPLQKQLRSCLRQQCIVGAREIADACKDLLSRYPR